MVGFIVRPTSCAECRRLKLRCDKGVRPQEFEQRHHDLEGEIGPLREMCLKGLRIHMPKWFIHLLFTCNGSTNALVQDLLSTAKEIDLFLLIQENYMTGLISYLHAFVI